MINLLYSAQGMSNFSHLDTYLKLRSISRSYQSTAYILLLVPATSIATARNRLSRRFLTITIPSLVAQTLGLISPPLVPTDIAMSQREFHFSPFPTCHQEGYEPLRVTRGAVHPLRRTSWRNYFEESFGTSRNIDQTVSRVLRECLEEIEKNIAQYLDRGVESLPKKARAAYFHVFTAEGPNSLRGRQAGTKRLRNPKIEYQRKKQECEASLRRIIKDTIRKLPDASIQLNSRIWNDNKPIDVFLSVRGARDDVGTQLLIWQWEVRVEMVYKDLRREFWIVAANSLAEVSASHNDTGDDVDHATTRDSASSNSSTLVSQGSEDHAHSLYSLSALQAESLGVGDVPTIAATGDREYQRGSLGKDTIYSVGTKGNSKRKAYRQDPSPKPGELIGQHSGAAVGEIQDDAAESRAASAPTKRRKRPSFQGQAPATLVTNSDQSSGPSDQAADSIPSSTTGPRE